MPRRRVVLLCAGLLAFVGGATSSLRAAGGSQEQGAPAWLRLGPGAEWVYQTHRDRQYAPVGAASRRDFFLGRSSQRVVQRRGTQAAPQFLLEETFTERNTSGGPLRSNTVREWWSVGPYGARVHDRDETGFGDVEIGANDFDPPLVYLSPNPAPEARWQVGAARVGTLGAQLEATVVGVESVKIAATVHDGCLKVHYAGPLTGTFESRELGHIEVKEGSIERYAWWKPGVGIVQDVTSMRAQLKLQDGKEAALSEVFSKRLEHHVPAR